MSRGVSSCVCTLHAGKVWTDSRVGRVKDFFHLVSSETRTSRRPCVHRVFFLWNSLTYFISEITPKTNHTSSAFCQFRLEWKSNLWTLNSLWGPCLSAAFTSKCICTYIYKPFKQCYRCSAAFPKTQIRFGSAKQLFISEHVIVCKYTPVIYAITLYMVFLFFWSKGSILYLTSSFQ